MSPLFETIKCKDGALFNLRYHQVRFNEVRKECFGLTEEIYLAETVKIPETCKTGLFRCRVIYSEKIEKIEFIPHKYRPVNSLKLVKNNQIDYRYKFTNRKKLEQLFEQRGDCDDILIVKNGCITDSFTANVVFFDGQRWWTPNSPLLPGTQRARLLQEGKISECRITPSDLPNFQQAGLINAMQDLNEMPVLKTENILTF